MTRSPLKLPIFIAWATLLVMPACNDFRASSTNRDAGNTLAADGHDNASDTSLDIGATADGPIEHASDTSIVPREATGGGAGNFSGNGGSVTGTGGVGVGGATGGNAGASVIYTGGSSGTGGMAPPGTGGRVAGTGGLGSGTGGVPALAAALVGSTIKDFGNVETGVSATPVTWTVRNTGTVPTGVLNLTNGNASEFSVSSNTCTGILVANGSCSLNISFKPFAGGTRTGVLTLDSSPGGEVTFSGTANAQHRVTVSASGVGTVTSTPAGISCGSTCSMLANEGAVVTLQARVMNGTNAFFSGWGGACSSSARDCRTTVRGLTAIAATFSPMTNNLVFVSSTQVPTNKEGAAAYDAVCNAAATAAGTNTSAGNGFVAYVSDEVSLAKSRIPATARGWVRMDGKPFADRLSSLLTGNQVFNPVILDETGNSAADKLLLTGSNADGSLGSFTCNNWTSAASTDLANVAVATGGPGAWSFANLQVGCSATAMARVLCMGITKTLAVSPIPSPGKKLWLSRSTYSPGMLQTPDAACQADRPSGVTTAAALLAHPNTSAAALLDPAATYVRMDGTFVGTGASMALPASTVSSGIWQSSDGTYHGFPLGDYPRAWTGAWQMSELGTEMTTCANWTSLGRTGVIADWTRTDDHWWSLGMGDCTHAYSLYCIQTAP